MLNFEREERINKERIRRLANWCKGKKEYPLQIDVELHKRCNLRCVFCARYEEHEKLNKESKSREMNVEKWLEIVEEVKKLNALVFNIEGINEPPAAPKLFFPVIEKVKELNLYGILTTNGTLWKEDKLKSLVVMRWDRIHFSLHSSKPQIHDKLTGMNGSFRKVIKSIQTLNKWRKKLNSERPMLNINVCINKLNFRDLPRIVEMASKLKADYIFTEPLMVYSSFQEKLRIKGREIVELRKVVENAKRIAEKYGIDNNFGNEDKNLEERVVEHASKMKSLLMEEVKNLEENFISAPCFKPWSQIAIRFDGSVSFCGYSELKESVNGKSLKEIWFGEVFEEARKKMLMKKLFSHCNKCVPSDFTQRIRFRRELIQALSGKND